MFRLFNFDFLNTISNQLHEALEGISVTNLNSTNLQTLRDYQTSNRATQGVYLLYYDETPVYLGKAGDIAGRLEEHLEKLKGRTNIDASKAAYKCILLDKSMSTAANEEVLISLFKDTHDGMWNGKGFGPKDPGQERDTTKPSWFDREFPIRLDINIPNLADRTTLKDLCAGMKNELPYVFRYNLGKRKDEIIDISSISHRPEPLLKAIVNHLGEGWRGAIISYGLVLYKNAKNYPHGTMIDPEVDLTA